MKFDRCFGCMEQVTAYPCPNCGYKPGAQALVYALRPGVILNGKYLLGKVLGHGHFGITYIGWDLALGRKVAVKELFPSERVSRVPGTLNLQWHAAGKSLMSQQDAIRITLLEARKMTKVEGIREVVQVHDTFQDNATAYIVMDLIKGQTLMDYIAKNGPMSWPEAKKIFLPAIRAMEQVHQAGLIHRDLSPDNLMLEPGGSVKILDLETAKDPKIASDVTSRIAVIRGFSPPEQYTQRGGSGPWTDVYAMAATMYYALTGVLPPTAVDRLDRDALDWNLPRLRQLPQSALDALKSAMALNPESRTRSMAALEQALFVTPAPQSDPPVRKTPKMDWSWVIVATILTLGVVLWINWPFRQTKATQQLQEQTTTQASNQTASEAPQQTSPSQWRSNVLRSSGTFDSFSDFGGIQRERVKTVTFLDTLADAPADSVDVSESQDGSVLLWAEANGELYDLYIAGEGGVNGEAACKYLFYGCTNLQSVDFNHCFHTENATDFYLMFSGCESLEELDLSGWDTSSVTVMHSMFSDCISLESLNLSGWDTSLVTSMNGMFGGCTSLSELELSGWDTPSVTDMTSMFWGCESLTELDLSGWDTSSVTETYGMFSCCRSLTSLNLTDWDTSSVIYMTSMFNECTSLTELDLSGWDTSSVTGMGFMFYQCESLADLNLSGWDTSSVDIMNCMFALCDSLTEPNLSGWDVSNVKRYDGFMDDGKTINGRPWREFFR